MNSGSEGSAGRQKVPRLERVPVERIMYYIHSSNGVRHLMKDLQ